MSTFSTPENEGREAETAGEPVGLTGHPVVDDHHQKVGTVSDVLYDEDGQPQFAVVDPGPLRAEKFVPVDGAYVTESGDVVIPYSKDQVKSAPKAGRDHVLDQATEAQIVEHYEA